MHAHARSRPTPQLTLPTLQVRREVRARAYERALGDTMHSGEQAAIQACLDLLRVADTMEVRSGASDASIASAGSGVG